VYCDAEHQVLEGVNVEDTVNMVARNQHGLLISFSMNQFQAPNESHWFIHCDKGSLKMETHNQRLGIMKHGDSDWQWTVLPKEERDSGFIRQANSFLDAVEGKESYLSTITEAAQTLRVQLAALESARTGQRISDLAKP
jgi:predicted dehydrogenase